MSEDQTSTDAVASYLKEHPRMMGALFTMVMLLSQAGTVVAGNNGATAGP
jgi:hypothetical protein